MPKPIPPPPPPPPPPRPPQAVAEPATTPIIIAVINQKGGVAKTTTAVNLAVALADSGHRVLAVDLDPQAHLTLGLGVDSANIPAEQTVARLFYETDALPALLRPVAGAPTLFLLPASIHLALAVESLYAVIFRETKLKKALQRAAPLDPRAAVPPFDYVILDSGPNLGVLSVNAIAAADKILVPTRLSLYSLGGLSDLLKTVREIRGSAISHGLGSATTGDAPTTMDANNGGPPDLRILLTMVKGGAARRQEVAQELLEPLRDRLLTTRIRESEAIERSQMEDGGDEGALLAVVRERRATNRGAADYQALAREILALWPPLSRQP